MTGGDDPDNRRDFPGGWKEDAASAFENLGAKAQEDLFQPSWMICLRAATPALRRGTLICLPVEDGAYAFARVTDGIASSWCSMARGHRQSCIFRSKHPGFRRYAHGESAGDHTAG